MVTLLVTTATNAPIDAIKRRKQFPVQIIELVRRIVAQLRVTQRC